MVKAALLIGVSEYAQGLSPLPKALNDIEAMKKVLEQPELGGFTEVTVLPNPDPFKMQFEIEKLFSERSKDDLIVLFFSGHGVKDDGGNLYFATAITQKTPEGELIKSTAVPSRFIHDIMSNSRSRRQVVILDCCFSGAFAKGLSAKDDGVVDLKSELGGEGRAVLTSSAATQYSFEQAEGTLSVYTRYLVEGMTSGAADTDSDGMVSIGELHEYAKRKVHESAPAMKPKIYVVEEGFKILLTQSPTLDPLLVYRKDVEQCVSHGTISPIGRKILDELKEKLKISDVQAVEIETAVFKPYREYKEKLKSYQQVLHESMERESPLSDYAKAELKRYQEVLGLRDQDVAPIKTHISTTPKQVSHPMEQNLASAASQRPEAAAKTLSPSSETLQQRGLDPQNSTNVATERSSSQPATTTIGLLEPKSTDVPSSHNNARVAPRRSSSLGDLKRGWIYAGVVSFGLIAGSSVFLFGRKLLVEPPPECSVIGECKTEENEGGAGVSISSAYTRPEEEVELKSAVEERAASLGLAPDFLYSLADYSFHARHPELIRRAVDQQDIEQAKANEPLRMEWLEIAEDWLVFLQTNLSEDSITKIGKFQSSDDTNRSKKIRRVGMPTIALYDLADARFYSMFADSTIEVVEDVSQFLETDNGQQLWKGVALDTLKDVISDESTLVKKLSIEAQPFTEEGSVEFGEGTLAPGEGQVYLVTVAEWAKQLSVDIDAPPGSVQLSVFQPAFLDREPKNVPKSNEAIAHDTSQTLVVTPIEQAGVYSIVVVSKTGVSFDYRYSVTAYMDEVPVERPRPTSIQSGNAETEPN